MVNIDQDIKQRVKVIGLFFLQSYKILTGTMLSLFIPQKCEGDTVCSLEQNYNNNELYHKSLFYCPMEMKKQQSGQSFEYFGRHPTLCLYRECRKQ